MVWIDLAQDKDVWKALVNTAIGDENFFEWLENS
jgi:hypothetical protein